MKVQIKSTIWIIERSPKISAASYEDPIKLIYAKHKNHVGWINITSIIDAKEVFLVERRFESSFPPISLNEDTNNNSTVCFRKNTIDKSN
jgi:hypothetical protein